MKKQAYIKPMVTTMTLATEQLLGNASFGINRSQEGSNDVFGTENTINARQHNSIWDDEE